MNEHEKKELLEFINNVLVELGNINNKQKGNQKPFLKFCCYEEDKGYAYFYQRKFEKTFNTSGYELKGFNIVSDEEESKSEKTDKKDIIKVLDSIVKDDEIRAKINIGMCASKDFRGRPYKVPINGKTFLGLFEKLYTDAANVKK